MKRATFTSSELNHYHISKSDSIVMCLQTSHLGTLGQETTVYHQLHKPAQTLQAMRLDLLYKAVGGTHRAEELSQMQALLYRER